MGYLDFEGLQYLWGKLKEKFAAKSHTHDERYYTEAEMNSKLGEKQNIRNGTKSGDVDWNTLVTPGAYKIQKCTMTTAYNAPANEYAYGILEVIDGEGNTGDHRLLQIYHPHNTSGMWYRMNNKSDGYTSWTAWVKLAVKPATAGTADKANAVPWSGVTDKPSTYPPSTHDHDLSALINKLTTGTSTPVDADYYVSQYAGGGASTTTYHRRPMSALWNYIKGKANGVYLKLSGGTITGKITKNGGGNWISDRDNVAVFGTKSTKDNYDAVVGQKTPSGAWTMGNLANNENLIFNYSTDTNYNAGTNDSIRVSLPAQAGTIITSATIENQSVSSATTATKLSSSAGSATRPVYFSDGKPVAGTYTLGNASSKTVRTLGKVGAAGWKDLATDQRYVPDMAFMAYWNGAYSGTASNLAYCSKGAFGTAATKNTGDFATASHSHPYLPTAGGTMTGNITFSSIGDTATSSKITWSGSSDGADIYYQTTAADQGNLVLNLRNDKNCYLRIASNGTFKSYFSPSDGNFHGNVNGKADTAGTADKANSVAWGNVTGKPSTYAPSSHTHNYAGSGSAGGTANSVNSFTFKAQTSDPGANSSLTTGQILLVYE